MGIDGDLITRSHELNIEKFLVEAITPVIKKESSWNNHDQHGDCDEQGLKRRPVDEKLSCHNRGGRNNNPKEAKINENAERLGQTYTWERCDPIAEGTVHKGAIADPRLVGVHAIIREFEMTVWTLRAHQLSGVVHPSLCQWEMR